MSRTGRFAGTLFLLATSVFVAAAAWAEPPACTHDDVTADVIDTFNYVQQYDLKSGMELSALTDSKDLGTAGRSADGKWAETRACAAGGTMVTGDAISVWYRIRLRDAAEPEDYRLELCFSKFDPIHADCEAFRAPPG